MKVRKALPYALVVFVGAIPAALAAIDDLLEFSETCETALALSALPAHLRDRANTWVLGKDGFERRGGDAPFSCLVTRNHAHSIVPQCFDEPGQRAILPKHLDEGRLIRRGESFDRIRAIVDERLASGGYRAADKPGLVYMMSAYNYIFGVGAGKLLHVHPHVMFHAPNLSADAVGNDLGQGMRNRGLPFVIDEGVHGYIISMVENPADTADVETACKDQLPAPPTSL